MKHFIQKKYDGSTEVRMYETEIPDQVGRMAVDFVQRWGMVAAEPDGEDSCGRQKLRILTPVEMAERACASAEALWTELERRGHIFDMPAPTPADMPGDS